MSALPPSLLYFVIYNPTLEPSLPVDDDDEDAEEQAHVLFYTAKEHAVSRDTVLRQVGLAKAVVNFSSMFDAESICESVHSLSRRMVTISPEPSYWIHACIELAKTQRVPKKIEKDKRKQTAPTYDHDESSVHDSAVRTQLMQGYDRFKLLYGTFASIMSSEGKDALELQLERFFTVWAWSWDLSKPIPFVDYLGTRIHPLSNQLTPHLEALTLPEEYESVVLVATGIVASKSSAPSYPPSLLPYLLSLLERPTPRPRQVEPDGTENGNDTNASSEKPSQPDNKTASDGASTRFLGTPQFNMNMDVRKWSWPNYLTFGRKSSTANLKVTDAANDTHKDEQTATSADAPTEAVASTEVEKSLTSHIRSESRVSIVDSIALEDALTSDSVTVSSSASTRPPSPSPSPPDTQLTSENQGDDSAMDSDADALMSRTIVMENKAEHALPVEVEAEAVAATAAFAKYVASDDILTSERCSDISQPEPMPEPELTPTPRIPKPSFQNVRVYLPCSEGEALEQRQVLYIKKESCLFALVPLPSCVRELESEDERLVNLAGDVDDVISEIKDMLDSEQEKISAAMSSAPVQDVFQRSQHVITTPHELVHSSTSFSCTSWHLHEGRRAFSLNHDVLEIFSRGQNPQDWHLVKRGPDANSHGDVYMEIGRKEASLTDVDYELSALVRRFSD